MRRGHLLVLQKMGRTPANRPMAALLALINSNNDVLHVLPAVSTLTHCNDATCLLCFSDTAHALDEPVGGPLVDSKNTVTYDKAIVIASLEHLTSHSWRYQINSIKVVTYDTTVVIAGLGRRWTTGADRSHE